MVGEVAVAGVEVVAEEGGHGSPEEEEVLEFLIIFVCFLLRILLHCSLVPGRRLVSGRRRCG